ncbi:hypothetical protein [Phaeobacter inhibens]|uniref:hypothetical protein n=1 Tax=Phaeobacter inhibens TaxID=221822 RepID=UPI0021A96FCD|nr:hypothetical protein [Phaeobacter inhibens]UWR57090.1 hypothetical protein K4F89_01125 [Phaeobacter inhibens]
MNNFPSQGEMLLRNDDILKKFHMARRTYAHALSDLENGEKEKIYTFDFSLLHPFIFRSTSSKDVQYDTLGRSIFSLLPIYSNITGFKSTLSTPSALELLDSLEHRLERLNRLAGSTKQLGSITDEFKSAFESTGDLTEEQISKLSRTISSLRLNDSHSSMGQLLELFQEKKITLLRDHIDPSNLRQFRRVSKEKFDAAYARMEAKRGKFDGRNTEDRNFHYKVDCWNLIISLYSRELEQFEIDHICRDGISKFLVTPQDRKFTRHPHVALLRLISLLRASELGNIEKEAAAFSKFGFRDLDQAMAMLQSEEIENLTNEESSELNRVWNKYGRPLYFDYSSKNGAVDVNQAMKAIRDMENNKYRSITTKEGLSEMFRADAEDIKKTAETVLEISPDILETRVLDDYELSDDPRIDQIRRKFNF